MEGKKGTYNYASLSQYYSVFIQYYIHQQFFRAYKGLTQDSKVTNVPAFSPFQHDVSHGISFFPFSFLFLLVGNVFLSTTLENTKQSENTTKCQSSVWTIYSVNFLEGLCYGFTWKDLMSVRRHQNLRRWQQEDANSMLGEADLAKLSGQKSIWWKAVRKEEIGYAHAISSYGNSIYASWIPGTWTV